MSILVRRDGEVVWLQLNRAECGNAIDRSTIVELDRALDGLIQQRPMPRCAVLTGTGRTFCSGIDLRAIGVTKGRTVENGDIVARQQFDHLILRLIEFRLPIIAAVQGPAIGAGMTLALTADLMILEKDAYLHPSFTTLGFVPDQGMSFLLPRLIGGARARAAMLLAEKIDAATALSWGLAYKVVGQENFAAEIQAAADKFLRGPPNAQGMTRPLWLGCDLTELREHMNRERWAQDSAMSSGECSEGVRAFLEKRKPTY